MFARLNGEPIPQKGVKAFKAFAPFLFLKSASSTFDLNSPKPKINLMITGKVLKMRGWKEGRTIGLAKKAAHALADIGQDETQILERLDAVLADPDKWTGDPIFFEVASEILSRERNDASKWADALRETSLPYEVWGADGIDDAANKQMENALRLPVAVAGALMPDAHVGYGLPIGGVLATQGTVIPYAVGVDIACFTGDTLVPLADGKTHTMRELAQRDEPFVVFSITPEQRIVAARAICRKTRENMALVEVELDNGETIRCTPDHRFMLRDGSYYEAQNLRAQTSLMPFYSRRDENGFEVQQPDSGAWQNVAPDAIFTQRVTLDVAQSSVGLDARNHKVVRVTPLEIREDVYCLSVPDWENFALAAGVFVHNCRMRLSIYDVSPNIMGQHKGRFEKSLVEQTQFGAGCKWSGRDQKEHDVLDHNDWRATRFLHSLRGKAIEQLGTSGGGNHFVEWGEFTLDEDSAEWNLKAGKYLSLLSHSGSRGVGFKIANEYSRLARGLHPNLPDVVKHLAWLDMDSDAGREYWIGMELAGRFASACHEIIHREVAKAAGFKEVAAIENHHNFAWKETMADGSEAIVHRKGATPAGAGVLGIIPGSMADPGYVVRGKGVMASLNSASHGAGRAMSRRAAKDSITSGQVRKYLEYRGVKLLGGGLDEAPMAYKNIEEVIGAQRDLVDILGQFAPKIVMMANDSSDV